MKRTNLGHQTLAAKNRFAFHFILGLCIMTCRLCDVAKKTNARCGSCQVGIFKHAFDCSRSLKPRADAMALPSHSIIGGPTALSRRIAVPYPSTVGHTNSGFAPCAASILPRGAAQLCRYRTHEFSLWRGELPSPPDFSEQGAVGGAHTQATPLVTPQRVIDHTHVLICTV